MRHPLLLTVPCFLVACGTSSSTPSGPPSLSSPPSPLATTSEDVRVTLGGRASEPFSVHHEPSAVGVRVSLVDALDVPAEVRGDVTVYPRALGDGANVEHHALRNGTEDFVRFPRKPAREELRYRLELVGAAGLRLVPGSQALEVVDAGGAPRVRMAPPWGVSVDGTRFSATTQLVGCAVDENPAPPWGRPPTPPGADACEVVVSWAGARAIYPATIDPAWTSTAPMTDARQEHTATLLADGRVLVAGGLDVKATAELFDPSTSTWATTGSMLAPRRGHTAARLPDGRVILVGGVDWWPVETELFDPKKGTFSLGPELVLSRRNHAMTTLQDGRLIVVGGIDMGKEWESLDPAESKMSWKLGGTTLPRANHVAVPLVDGRVLVAGGTPKAVEILDPTTNTSTVVGELSLARRNLAASRLADGSVLLIGGLDDDGGTPTSVVERFDPKASGGAGAIVPAAPLLTARGEHGVATRADGKVVVLGGVLANGESTTGIEVFDPTTGTWTSPGALQAGRALHTVTALQGAALLVSGGRSAGGASLSSAELCADGICAKTPCKTTADCEPGLLCGGGFCKTIAPAGADCAVDADCSTGHCAQGVCCATACSGECISCNAKHKEGSPSGVCGPIAEGQDPFNQCEADDTPCGATGTCGGLGVCTTSLPPGTSCGSSSATCVNGQFFYEACNGKGACLLSAPGPICSPAKTCSGTTTCGPNQCTDDAGCAPGFVCQNGTCVGTLGTDCLYGASCASGHCSDSICCDTACDGVCETCAGPGPGTCKPRAVGPAKWANGQTPTSCRPSCDGKTTQAHYPGPETPCTANICVDWLALQGTTGACNGSGDCSGEKAPTTPCFPYRCLVGDQECQSDCLNTAMCAPGAVCLNGKCKASGSGIGGGGSGGAGNGGGGAGGGGGKDASTDTFAPTGASPEEPTDGGCGCRATGAGPTSGGLATMLGFLLLAIRRRRAGPLPTRARHRALHCAR